MYGGYIEEKLRTTFKRSVTGVHQVVLAENTTADSISQTLTGPPWNASDFVTSLFIITAVKKLISLHLFCQRLLRCHEEKSVALSVLSLYDSAEPEARTVC